MLPSIYVGTMSIRILGNVSLNPWYELRLFTTEDFSPSVCVCAFGSVVTC